MSDMTYPHNGRVRATTGMILMLVAAGLIASAGFAQTFTDVAASAGVMFHQESEFIVPIGGGAIWADFNNDGWDDLYITQGTKAMGDCNRLFKNMGDGTFQQVPNGGGAADCGAISHGGTAADYDNDGDEDLYVTNYGQNHLFKNMFVENGAVSFMDVTVAAGMGNDGAYNSSSASFGDYDNDGLLDLAVVNHSMVVPITADSCKVDRVYHNMGGGVFQEVGAALGVANSGITGKPGCGLAVTWSDYDNDGDVDLWVVNDFGEVNVQNKLFRNDGMGPNGWVLSDQGRWAGVDYPMFGMGISACDFNRDGNLDYYTSDIGPNNLALNIGNGTFAEIAAFSNTMASDRGIYGGSGLVSWGAACMDVTGDGYLDLFVANGGAPEGKWPGMFGPDYDDLDPIYAFRNLGGSGVRFSEGHNALGVTSLTFHRTIAASDYDRDGDMDFHAGVLQDDNALYRNDTPVDAHRWLEVKLTGTTSNRDAIGAKVIARNGQVRQLREVNGGAGFLSRGSLVQHFLVGNAMTVDELVVRFPSGKKVTMTNVPTNQIVQIVEP